MKAPHPALRNLSNTCWAYAKIGIRHDPLIKALRPHLCRGSGVYVSGFRDVGFRV